MPRVTPSTHYHRYQFLHTAWLEFPKLYALLPLQAQWQVHEFYQPSKDLTKDELVAHVKELIKIKPVLVHQVGKHVKLMENVFRYVSKSLNVPRSEWYKALDGPVQYYNPLPASMETHDGHRYTVAGVARPEPNVQLLAKALLELAKQQVKEANREGDRPAG